MLNKILNGIVITAVIMFLMIGCFCSVGCEVLKKKSSASVDSVKTAKVDSGLVTKNETTENKQKEYERVTYLYPPQPRDCTINKYYTYPSTVIYEKGKEAEQSRTINYDSLWKNKVDSLAVKLSKVDKSKETKVLGFWQILAIAAGVGLVFFVLVRLR